MDIIQRLRNNLKPYGTAPTVSLRTLKASGIEMHIDFITKCIDELERIRLRVKLGDQPSNLEKLAY